MEQPEWLKSVATREPGQKEKVEQDFQKQFKERFPGKKPPEPQGEEEPEGEEPPIAQLKGQIRSLEVNNKNLSAELKRVEDEKCNLDTKHTLSLIHI